MTTALITNAIAAIVVLSAILGGLVWAIRTGGAAAAAERRAILARVAHRRGAAAPARGYALRWE